MFAKAMLGLCFMPSQLRAEPAVQLLFVATVLVVEQGSISWRQTANVSTPASAGQSTWMFWSKSCMSSVASTKYFGTLQSDLQQSR